MHIRSFARRIQISMLAGLVAVSVWPSRALAQDDHMHAMPSTPQPLTATQLKQTNELVTAVRSATAPFQNPASLPSDYALMFGCVSGSGNEGAMGLHFVNLGLVFDGGELELSTPEIVLYEPVPGGGFKLTGADYLVLAADWDA